MHKWGAYSQLEDQNSNYMVFYYLH